MFYSTKCALLQKFSSLCYSSIASMTLPTNTTSPLPSNEGCGHGSLILKDIQQVWASRRSKGQDCERLEAGQTKRWCMFTVSSLATDKVGLLAPQWPYHPWNPKKHSPMHRSEEHTSELQSLLQISYAVFCLKNAIKPVLSTSIATQWHTITSKMWN